jgi:hypothetical protein
MCKNKFSVPKVFIRILDNVLWEKYLCEFSYLDGNLGFPQPS